MNEVTVVEEKLCREFRHKEISQEHPTKPLGSSIASRPWFIFLLAFSLRLLTVAFLVGNQLCPERDHWEFGAETGRIARSLASGHGFGSPLFGWTGPTAWMGPIYPSLLAGVFAIFGIYSKASAYTILSLNALFASLTSLPLYSIARRLFGTSTAIWSCWVWALFPYSFFFSAGVVWNTSLNALLLTVAVALTLRLEREAGAGLWPLWGGVWAIAALTEPTLVACLPAAVLWLVFRLRRRGECWVFWGPRVLAAAFTFVVVLVPWGIRNYRIFHRLIPLRSNFGLVLYQGNTADTFDLYPDWANPPHNPDEMAEYTEKGEMAYMAHKKREAIANIRANPFRFAVTTLRRVVFTWTGYWNLSREYIRIEPFAWANVFMTTLLSAMAGLGFVLAWCRSWDVKLLFAGLFLSFPSTYYVTHPSMAYRHPLDPFLLLYATYAVVSIAKRNSSFDGIGEDSARPDEVLAAPCKSR
jgi:4-amino-4-deoxy-L-arabinose transferase-like glycosyltransferase